MVGASNEDSGGGDWLRILGQILSAAPQLYDDSRPVAGDPALKALGKHAMRYGGVMAVGGLVVMVGGMTAVKCH